jgi:ABC-type Zn2+ transport system substrate-binding protein/surface adhesin
LFEPQPLTPEQKAAYEQEMADFRRRLREAKERLKKEVCC